MLERRPVFLMTSPCHVFLPASNGAGKKVRSGLTQERWDDAVNTADMERLGRPTDLYF
jgi:hypothetical protein